MEPQRPPLIFNQRRSRLRRERAGPRFAACDFLHRRAMADVVDRLETVKRDFPYAAFCGAGGLASMLTPACGVGARIEIDAARARLDPQASARRDVAGAIVAEEERLPFAPRRLDLFVSLFTLHGADDLIGALAQIRASLKPDGLFVGVLFGEGTLARLRRALYQAESELTGGVAARIAPFAAVQDAGRALSRAGFALPVADVDKVTVRYSNPLKLIADLRGMGEGRALASPAPPLRRDVVARAMALFEAGGGEETFDVIYLTGWAPHESQQKPLRPGSAKASLEAAVKGGAPVKGGAADDGAP